MKKLFTLILGLGMVAGANAQNPFAYGLSTDGNVVSPSAGELTVTVNYSLNADAESVNALIKNAEGEVVKTLPLSGIAKGTYKNVELDLAGIGHGNFTWAIEVKGGATSGNISTTPFKSWGFYHPCGLDIDNSPESPSFGTIFVTEGYFPSTETMTNRMGFISQPANNGNVADASGLYMFTPEFESIKGQDGYARFYPSFLTHSHQYSTSAKAGADFSKVAIADDGRIFVSRHNNLGDYILVAESVESLVNGGEFTSLVADKTMTDATIYTDANGNFLAGPTQSMDVKGGGEETKIIVIARNVNNTTVSNKYSSVVEYEIGTSTALTSATSFTALDKSSTLSYDRAANVAYDNHGGVWFCQNQSSTTYMGLAYVNANGEKTVISMGGSRTRGAVAVSPDGTMLAASSGNGGLFSIYNINYAEDGTVSVSEIQQLDLSTSGTVNIYSTTWDCAGNFYCGNATNEWVKGFAVPRANNVFATPAASKYALTIDEATAVGEINTDANAPVEYYNLQGVKVENPAGGIFIRKQGGKTTKVVL